MKKRKNKVVLIILLVIGLLGSASLYFAFSKNMVEVVVATQTVRGNTPITSSMVTTAKVDKNYLPENYIEASYLKEVVGRYSDVGFSKGAVLSSDSIATGDGKKAATIPDGYTLLSVAIENLPQGVVAGDKVNLLIGTTLESEGKVVLTYQNIKVTNTSVDADGAVVGLEVQVTPAQAQKIAFAQLNGDLSVSLLPGNYEDEELPIVTESEFTTYSSTEGNSTSNSESYNDSKNTDNE